MTYNLLQDAISVKNDVSCKYDTTYGFNSIFITNGDVEGWDIYSRVYLYGSWNKVLFGSSKENTCYIGRTDNFVPVTADAYYNFKLMMKLTSPVHNYKNPPTKGKLQWLTDSDNIWDDNKSVEFDLVQTDSWHQYNINLAELQFWTGSVSNLRITPFMDGYSDIRFAIKFIRIESDNIYKCLNTQCSYYGQFTHPCQGIGGFGSVTSAISQTHYTTVSGLSDSLLVNIDNYGDEQLNLGTNTNITGQEMAKLIMNKLSLIDIGGYAYSYSEHTEDNKLLINSGSLGFAEDINIISPENEYSLYITAYAFVEDYTYFDEFNLTLTNPLPYFYTITGSMPAILEWLFVNDSSDLTSILTTISNKNIFIDIMNLRTSVIFNICQVKLDHPHTSYPSPTIITTSKRADISIMTSMNTFSLTTLTYPPNYLKDITNDIILLDNPTYNMYEDAPILFEVNSKQLEVATRYSETKIFMLTVEENLEFNVTFGSEAQKDSVIESTVQITNEYIKSIYPYAGFYEPTTVQITGGTAAEPLGFRDGTCDISSHTYGAKPASGFEFASSRRLRACEISKLIDQSNSKVAYFHNPDQHVVEAGRRDYFESITANSVANSNSPDFYKKLDGENYIIIDTTHPVNDGGRLNNIKVNGVKYEGLTPSVLLFRPFKDGSLVKLYETTFPAEEEDALYTVQDSTYFIKCDWLTTKGDVIGFKNFGPLCPHSSITLLPNGLIYRMPSSTHIDSVFYPFGLFSQGVIGTSFYAYSDGLQDSMKLLVDIGKRTNISSIEVYGKELGDVFEYNLAACLDVSWQCDTHGQTHLHTTVNSITGTTSFWEHANIAYGLDSLNNCVVTTDGGKQGAQYTNGSDGLVTSGQHAYFYINGDMEWPFSKVGRGEFGPPWGGITTSDYEYDPLSIFMIFPAGKSAPIIKSAIYFKEASNFKHMSLSYYRGPTSPEGNAEGVGYQYIEEFSEVVLDGVSYRQEDNNDPLVTIYDYILPNPMPWSKLVYVDGEATNWGLYQVAGNTEWNIMGHSFAPIEAYGYKIYCDWHKSTKIIEIELYSYFNVIPTLVDNFTMKSSTYGNFWDDVGFKEDEKNEERIYAPVISAPRYLKLDISPQSPFELYELVLNLEQSDLKTLSCVDTLLINKAPKGKITQSSALEVENVYDVPLSLRINIPNQINSNENILAWNELSSDVTSSLAKIGPGALIKKNEDYPLFLHNHQIAINCPSYYLNNLIDNKKAYIFENESDWAYHSTLTNGALIAYANHGDIFKLNIAVDVLSNRYCKVVFNDLESHNLYTINAYYEGNEVPISQVYMQAGSYNLGDVKVPMLVNSLGAIEATSVLEDHFDNSLFMDYWQYTIPVGNGLTESLDGLYANTLVSGTNSFIERVLDTAVNSFELEFIVDCPTVSGSFIDLTDPTYTIGSYQPNYPGAAFDNELVSPNADTAWYSINGSDIGQLFPESTLINEYKLYPINMDNREADPKDWTFEASNNGIDWDILDTRVNELFVLGNWKSYHIQNETYYTYYRLNVSATYDPYYIIQVRLQELEFGYTAVPAVEDLILSVDLRDGAGTSLFTLEVEADGNYIEVRGTSINPHKEIHRAPFNTDNYYFETFNTRDYISTIGNKIKIVVRKEYMSLNSILVTNLDGSVILYSSSDSYTYFLSRVNSLSITYSNRNLNEDIDGSEGFTAEYISMKALPILSSYEALVLDMGSSVPIDEIEMILANNKIHYTAIYVSNLDQNDYLIWSRNFNRSIGSLNNRSIYASGFIYQEYAYYPPWYAFDKQVGFQSIHSWGYRTTSLPQWLTYDFGLGNAKVIRQIYCYFGFYGAAVDIQPTHVEIYGSNDSSINWLTKPKTLLLAHIIDYNDPKVILLLNNTNSYSQYCFYFPEYTGSPSPNISVGIYSAFLYDELTPYSEIITTSAESGTDTTCLTDGQLDTGAVYSSFGEYLLMDLGKLVPIKGVSFVQISNGYISYFDACHLEYSLNSTDGVDGDWAMLHDFEDVAVNNFVTQPWWVNTIYFDNQVVASWVRLVYGPTSSLYLIEFDVIIGDLASQVALTFSTFNDYFAIDLEHTHYLDFLRSYGPDSTNLNLTAVATEFSITDTADPGQAIWSDVATEARWLKIPLLNGDGVDRLIQYLGVYPNTSYAYRKSGGFNCDWLPVGNLLSRYNVSYNLAAKGIITPPEYIIYDVKSIIIDIFDNYGSYYIGLRSIEFYDEFDQLVLLPSSDFDIYTTAPRVTGLYSVENVFKTPHIKTGDWKYGWLDPMEETRIICVLSIPIKLSKIVINNGHHSASETDVGAKIARVVIAEDIITDLDFGTTISGSTVIFDGYFREHSTTSQIDDEVIFIGQESTTPLYYFDWSPQNCISGDKTLDGFGNCWAFTDQTIYPISFVVDLGTDEYINKFFIVHSYLDSDTSTWMNTKYIISGRNSHDVLFTELFNITDNSANNREHIMDVAVSVRFVKLEIIEFTKPSIPLRVYNDGTGIYTYLDGGFVREFEVWASDDASLINSEQHPVVCIDLKSNYKISGHELITNKKERTKDLTWDNSEEFFRYSDNVSDNPNQISFTDSTGTVTVFNYTAELLNATSSEVSLLLEESLYLASGYYSIAWESYGATSDQALFIAIKGSSSVIIFSENIATGWVAQSGNFNIEEEGLYSIVLNSAVDELFRWGIRNLAIRKINSNSKWVSVRRNTATNYSWDNDTNNYGVDYLSNLKVFTSNNFRPTEVPWWWSSTVSSLSEEIINTKVGAKALRIEYPTSSGVDRLDFLEGDHFGWDEHWSIKDTLSFWWYISDLNNLYIDEGGFGFGSFYEGTTDSFIDSLGKTKTITPKMAMYTWDFKHMQLKTGWNQINLQFDENTLTNPLTSSTTNMLKSELNFRESFFTSFGVVYKGIGASFYMLLDGLEIRRNKFNDDVVFGNKGLCLNWKEYAEIPLGGLTLRQGSIEFWNKFYTNTAGRDSFGDARSRTLFTIVNNNNEIITLSIRSAGWFEVGFGGARYGHKTMYASPAEYNLGEVVFSKDDVAHVALVWSNSGKDMTNNDTIRLYINNTLIISSKETWSVGDSKSAILRLGGASTILDNNNDQEGSAIFSNVKVYDYCKDSFNINQTVPAKFEKLNHNSLLQVSKNDIDFYDINSGQLPLIYKEVPPGEKVTIYTRVDKTNIGLVEQKTGTIDIEWEVIV